MKRLMALVLLLAAGCSTAPLADLLDLCKPGRLGAEQTPPYGGVCAPKQVGPPGGAVVPPPPLPPSGAP
jgi:hypothetical protein